MALWIHASGQVVDDLEDFVAPDGTNYPGAWPKADIPGMSPVILSPCPDDPSVVILSYTVDRDTKTQVWETRSKTAEELVAEETNLISRVNQEAGAARRAFITDVPGQEGTYMAKSAEAKAYQTDPNGNYPYLTAEASHTGKTVEQIAALVNATADAWTLINAQIEGIRRGAIETIQGGNHSVFPITWPAP